MALRPGIPLAHWLAQQAALAVLLVLLGCFVGCDGQSSSSPSKQDPDAPPSVKPTIVSLTPAITQMLIDMGKRDHLVGVSHRDAKGIDLPNCGRYDDPLTERILELRPDLVLTESSSADGSGVPPMLRTLADKGAYELGTIPHCTSIADIERALVDKEIGLGQAVGDQPAAERARALMSMQLELVEAAVADVRKPRVLMLINPSSLGAIGTGVTHDELLRRAGAVNAAGAFDRGYVVLERAQITAQIRPDVILIIEPDGGPIVADDPRLEALGGLGLRAIAEGRVFVISHPHAMLPSTSLPAVLAEMASAIHPERAPTIRQAYGMAQAVLKNVEQKAKQKAEQKTKQKVGGSDAVSGGGS